MLTNIEEFFIMIIFIIMIICFVMNIIEVFNGGLC